MKSGSDDLKGETRFQQHASIEWHINDVINIKAYYAVSLSSNRFNKHLHSVLIWLYDLLAYSNP